MFLKIQVTGKGRIPRIGGLAPRKTPFKAEPDFIKLIMLTPGLGVNYLNPETNQFVKLTHVNLQAVLEKYGNWDYNKQTTQAPTAPVAPKAVPVREEPKAEVVKEEVSEKIIKHKEEIKVTNNTVNEKVEVKEEKVEPIQQEEIYTIKPIYNEDTTTSTNSNKKGNDKNKK